MSPQSIDRKERRRQSLERKKMDRLRRNPIAQVVKKLGHPIVETKERGGAKNLLKDIEKDIIDE